MSIQFVNKNEAIDTLNKFGEEFVVVDTPDYVFPNKEIIPLSEKIDTCKKGVVGFLTDMDGTTTTTEELCIHSLEFMLRKMSGKMNQSQWKGVDEQVDYPHIIGNSTTKHVEYLIKKYDDLSDTKHIRESLLYATVWTIKRGKDQTRKEEALNTLATLNADTFLRSDNFRRLENDYKSLHQFCEAKSTNYISDTALANLSLTQKTRIGIELYYQRYHEILEKITSGGSESVAEELFGNSEHQLIKPMPGIAIFLMLIKGLVNEDHKNIADFLVQHYEEKKNVRFEKSDTDVIKILKKLNSYFEKNPAKIGIVTSSIFYEANIVMSEVFKILQKQIEKFSFSDILNEKIHNAFTSYSHYYDAFITASNASEMRLKPHKDLYCMGLHNLGVSPDQYAQVIGFEDSESGTVAIRAAGIGLCVAVPFAQTAAHNFYAAAYTLDGGIPEAIIDHTLFM